MAFKDETDYVRRHSIFDSIQIEKSDSFPKIKLKTSSLSNQDLYVDNDELDLKRKYAYGVGGIPAQLATSSLSFYLSIYLLEVAHMVPYNLFYVIAAGRIWDAISDPIAGYIVSKTNTRWGQFKPYMLVSVLPLCCSFFGLFYNPGFEDESWKLAYFVIAMLIFQTSITFYFIPYGSMAMVLTVDMNRRDELTAYRMIFEIIGLLIGSVYFGGVVSMFKSTKACTGNITVSPIHLEEQEMGYMIATSSCCCIIIICVCVTVFGSVEQDIFIEAEPFNIGFYKLILTFRPYLILMFTFACTGIGIMLVQANMALYITYVLKIPNEISRGILVMVILSVIFIPVGQILNRKLGKKVIYLSGMITIFPVLISLIFLPSSPSLIIFYAIMVWSSYPVMVAFFLPWSMLPDCIDYFSVTYNIRNEATIFSLFVFFQKFALGFAIGMTGIVLGLANYDSKLCVQPDLVALSLRYLIGIGSCIFYLIAMLLLYFYPVNEVKRHEIGEQMIKGQNLKMKAINNLKKTIQASILTTARKPSRLYSLSNGSNTFKN